MSPSAREGDRAGEVGTRASGQPSRGGVRQFLASHGVREVENRTHTLLTCIDGLVLDRLVGGGDVPREAVEGLVAAALR